MAVFLVGNAFNIVSGAFGAIGLASFGVGFVEHPPPAKTHLTVAIGQTAQSSDEDPENLAGSIPYGGVYAIDGRLVGSAGGSNHKWAAGSKNAVEINNDKGMENVQSEYVSVYATGKNAICISALGLKNPNDDTTYGWTADVGLNCGMDWHYSETIVGSTGNTAAYRSNCVWITGPGSKNDITSQEFSTHIIDFSQVTDKRAAQYSKDRTLMCNSAPKFSAWTSINPQLSPPFFIPALKYNDDGTDKDIKALFVPGIDKNDYSLVSVGTDGEPPHPVRQAPLDKDPQLRRRRSQGRSPFAATLISSQHVEHSARQLCESATSYGPDLDSESEGLFCDMDHKRLWPLCTDESQKACFDTKTSNMRGGSTRREVVPVKRYTTVKNWGSSGTK